MYAPLEIGGKLRIHARRPRGGEPAGPGPPLPGPGPPGTSAGADRRYLIASSFFLSDAIVLSERCPGGSESAIAIASSRVFRACAVSASPA